VAKETIEVAPSGRALCRRCEQPIAKGVLRFGFKLDEQLAWFHLGCAADEYPEKLERVLSLSTVIVPDREALDAAIAAATPAARRARLRRVDRAPTSRAACRHCKKLVARGTLRANVLLYDDTSTGAIHVACVNAYVSGDASAQLLAASTELSSADRAALTGLFAALALLDANRRGAMLERAIANGDAAALGVLGDWLEECGAAVATGELAAALIARRA
jgi:hypothetical protein